MAHPQPAIRDDDGVTSGEPAATAGPADAQRMARTAGGAVAMVEALRRLRLQLRRGAPADDLPRPPRQSG